MKQQKSKIKDSQVAAAGVRTWIQVSRPATGGQNGTLAGKFPGHPSMKYLFTSGAPHGGDLQAMLKKQYFLNKKIISRGHPTTTSLAVVFLQFMS